MLNYIFAKRKQSLYQSKKLFKCLPICL